MTLSVIVPVYNAGSLVDRCLQSLVDQDFPQLEIILVDDGSTDGSGSACDCWAQRHPQVKVVHQANQGLSMARNAGLAIARGEAVTFVDADDAVDRSTYAQVVPLLSGEVDMVEYPVLCGWQGPHPRLLSFPCRTYADGRSYWWQSQAYAHTYAWNKVYRRSLFREVRFPEGLVFEDAHTLPLILSRVRRVATTDKGCYLYYSNPGGITARATGKQLQSLLTAHLTHWDPSLDARFYARLLNIQIDVCRLTAAPPQLPALLPRGMNRCGALGCIKILLANILGIQCLCKLHRLVRHR